MENTKSNTIDRELFMSRTLDAPVTLVWEVWTKPEHIVNWWGPTGFTNTINNMDFISGDEWDLVMHGPDGRDYKNKNIFKEIVTHKKIVYDHVSYPKFTATIEFEDKGDKTFISWHMLFETAVQFQLVVKTFKADEGLKQNLKKLALYLYGLDIKDRT